MIWPLKARKRALILTIYIKFLNSLKCFFRVSSRKFLEFIVHKGGIELNPIKVKAIIEMPSPKTLKELKGI